MTLYFNQTLSESGHWVFFINMTNRSKKGFLNFCRGVSVRVVLKYQDYLIRCTKGILRTRSLTNKLLFRIVTGDNREIVWISHLPSPYIPSDVLSSRDLVTKMINNRHTGSSSRSRTTWTKESTFCSYRESNLTIIVLLFITYTVQVVRWS